MLQLTPQSIIFVATSAVDFRKGIDGLAAICRNLMLIDPLSGALFLFYNRCKTSFKILVFDGQGFWLIQKRLSKGNFRHLHQKFSPFELNRKDKNVKNQNVLIHISSAGGSTDPDSNEAILNSSNSIPLQCQYRQICHKVLGVLINNGDPASAKFPKDWRKPYSLAKPQSN